MSKNEIRSAENDTVVGFTPEAPDEQSISRKTSGKKSVFKYSSFKLKKQMDTKDNMSFKSIDVNPPVIEESDPTL